MTQYLVTFDRIGRSHGVAPLRCEAIDADALAEQIYRVARPHLRSQNVNVHVDLTAGNGIIFCGFNNGGRFTIEKISCTPNSSMVSVAPGTVPPAGSVCSPPPNGGGELAVIDSATMPITHSHPDLDALTENLPDRATRLARRADRLLRATIANGLVTVDGHRACGYCLENVGYCDETGGPHPCLATPVSVDELESIPVVVITARRSS